MKEILIASGKGGTGKTSITAALAYLAGHAVLADCDVDAANLHLVLTPTIEQSHDFVSGHEAKIRPADCSQCGICVERCRFDAIHRDDRGQFLIDPILCEGCGVCVWSCPVQAIDFPESLCGQYFRSKTRFGPMVHAKLNIAAENSGKLVSMVRKEAKSLAEKMNSDWILIDGPPGIGCPVIASMTGVDALILVTEPTLSGIHDMERMIELARHFGIDTYVCINRWDINQELTKKVEDDLCSRGISVIGKVPYDSTITAAQLERKCIFEYALGPAASEISKMWECIKQI